MPRSTSTTQNSYQPTKHHSFFPSVWGSWGHPRIIPPGLRVAKASHRHCRSGPRPQATTLSVSWQANDRRLSVWSGRVPQAPKIRTQPADQPTNQPISATAYRHGTSFSPASVLFSFLFGSHLSASADLLVFGSLSWSIGSISFIMKRIFTSMRRPSFARESAPAYPEDSPEAVILRELMAFCQSGNGPDIAHGTEFVHLPGIVESAESSPNAAKEAAHRIRKLLADPESSSPNIQYNAIMLMRILIENPGHTFSRNFDTKFVTTVRDLLRQGKDLYVKQFLSETLDTLEAQRSWDEDLGLLLGMWMKEKANPKWRHNTAHAQPPTPPRDPNVPVIHSSAPGLPPPGELAARVAEAKTSASLLTQFVQSTPPAETLDNELIKEFSGRCRNASRAVQDYIHTSNPPPDEDTLATLIETNDELSVALSKHQRAILQARKLLGRSESQSPASSNDASGVSGTSRPVPAPPVPPRELQSIPALQPVPASQVPATYEPASHGPASYGPPSLGPTAQELDSPVTSSHGQTSYGVVGAPGGTGTSATGPNRYEYRSEDFQVQNPFADSYGTNAGPPGAAGNPPADGTAPAPGSPGWWNSAHPPSQHTT